MIILNSDITLPFPQGTVLYGSTANAVLPDPTFAQMQVGSSPFILNKIIGDDLLIAPQFTKLKKIYDITNDTIFEYTLYQINISNQVVYTPISVKRYDPNNPRTYIFVRGVTLALDSLRGARDYSIISVTALMKSFSGRVMSFIDTMLSVELPSTVCMMLEDLGSYAYQDPDNSAITLNLAYASISGQYDEIFASTNPNDFLSIMGCDETNIVSDGKIAMHSDRNACSFYDHFNCERNEWVSQSAHNFLKLDQTYEEFHWFGVTKLLEELYRLPYSDIAIELTQENVQERSQILFGMRDIAHIPLTFISRELHDRLIHYNMRHRPGIVKIILTKDWLDNVILDLYLDDGSNRKFYLNMALYHLYSQSIIRLHPI